MKIEKVESKDSTFWKYYIKGSPLKKQYHSYFVEHVNFQE